MAALKTHLARALDRRSQAVAAHLAQTRRAAAAAQTQQALDAGVAHAAKLAGQATQPTAQRGTRT